MLLLSTPILNTFLYPTTVFGVGYPLLAVGAAMSIFLTAVAALAGFFNPMILLSYGIFHLMFWKISIKNPYFIYGVTGYLKVLPDFGNGHFFSKAKGKRYVP